MADIQVTVELDVESFDCLKTLAKNERRTLEDEAACLLEKGISVAESIEVQKKKGTSQINDKKARVG